MNIEPGYEVLAAVFQSALDQAQKGKGKERHANAEPFERQTIVTEAKLLGLGAPVYQARKKSLESIRLLTIRGPEAARSEILGAINYLAAAYISLEGE